MSEQIPEDLDEATRDGLTDDERAQTEAAFQAGLQRWAGRPVDDPRNTSVQMWVEPQDWAEMVDRNNAGARWAIVSLTETGEVDDWRPISSTLG